MLRYGLASQFWRTVPTGWADRAWRRRGRRLLSRAAQSVPAYAQLLAAFAPLAEDVAGPGSSPGHAQCQLKTSWRNYVEVFAPQERSAADGQHQVVAFDSLARPGATNDSWPRSSAELRTLREQLAGLLSGWFDVRQRRTLLLVHLPEAGWCAGRKIVQALREALSRGQLRGAVIDLREMTGRSGQESLALARQSGRCVVLCEGAEATRWACGNSRWPAPAGVVAFGPVLPSERAAMPEGTTLCSVWGMDEVGPLIGLETPLTRIVERACESNTNLQRTILPERPATIGLYQPFPIGPWIEQDDRDLLISCWGALPAIRYRSGQCGRLLEFAEVCRQIQRHKALPARQIRQFTRTVSTCWKLPLIQVTNI